MTKLKLADWAQIGEVVGMIGVVLYGYDADFWAHVERSLFSKS